MKYEKSLLFFKFQTNASNYLITFPVTDESSKSLQQEAKSTSRKKETYQTQPKRKSLQVRIVRGREDFKKDKK